MADTEKVRVIKIDTSQSVNSIKDLKDRIKEYKAELNNMAIGSDEARQKNIELREAQAMLTAAMNGAVKQTGELDNSYNGLVSQMAALKASWRATTDEVERDAIGKQIVAINDQLKAMDASVGNFQRNVGNYTNSMVDAFNKVGINIGNINPLFKTLIDATVAAGDKGVTAIGGLKGAVIGLGNSLKALAANPIGAIIMAIVLAVKAAVAIFDKFKESVNRNEVASNNMKKALAPIKGIVDGIRNAFDKFVEVCTKVAARIGEVTTQVLNFFGIAKDTIALENDIADLNERNAEQHRKFLVENSQLELDISDLRAKAYDKEKYTAQERLKFIEEVAKKEKQLAANRKKEAEDNLALLQKEAATGANDAAMNDKLAEAKAAVNQATKDYNDTLRTINKETARLSKEIQQEEKEAQNAIETTKRKNREKAAEQAKQAEDLVKLQKKGLEEIKKLRQDADRAYSEMFAGTYEKRINDISKKWANVIETQNNYIHGLEEQIKLIEKAGEDPFHDIETFEAQIEDAYKRISLYTRLQQNEINNFKETVDSNRLQAADSLKLLLDKKEQEYKDTVAIYYNILEAFEKNEISEKNTRDLLLLYGLDKDEIDEAINEVIAQIENNEHKLQEALKIDGLTEHLDDVRNNLLGQMTEFSSIITSIGDGISSEWGGIFDNLTDGFNKVSQNLKEGKKDWYAYGDMAVYAFKAIGSAMSALADEEEANTEESFERKKKLQISQVVMETLAGIMSCFAGDFTLKSGPWDWALAITQAAMMAAMGGVQIGKISKTQYNSDNTSALGGSTSMSTPQVNYQGIAAAAVPQTYIQDVGNAAIEESIGRQDIWVSVEEINKKRNSVGVAVTESRF